MPLATDGAAASQATVETVQLRVWDWLDAVAAAPDDMLRQRVKTLALAMPRYGAGLTGQDVRLPHGELATLLGVTERTVRRYLDVLQSAGYLKQTRRPSPDHPALYALYGPARFDAGHGRKRTRSEDTAPPDHVHRSPDTSTRESVHRPDPASTSTPDTRPHQTVHRVERNGGQKPGVTEDTTERDHVRYKQVSNSTSSSTREDSMMMLIEKCRPTDLGTVASMIKSLRPDWDRDGIVAALQRHLGKLPVGEAIEVARIAATDPQAQTPAAFGWHRDRRRTQPSAEIQPTCTHCSRPRPQCQQVQQKTGDRHQFQPDMQIGVQS